MSRAHRRGRELRRKLGLRGRVDVDAVANILGLEVVSWPFEKLEEMMTGDVIGVSARLDTRWRRWVVAHAIGHGLLHPGNHLWKRLHTELAHYYEREAEDFAHGLLLDMDEAVEELLVGPAEAAEHFGVPEEMVVFQQPLRME